MAIRTHGEGRVFHGESAARTATGLWRDGDVFVVRTTGATYVRTDGTWVVVGSGEFDPDDYAVVDHEHAGSDLLPNGSTTGDFLRWDGDSWAVAAEPLAMASGQIILTPAAAAALDAEGGLWYKSTDKSVYVCTSDA
jgi:hypothetical protein